MTEVNTKSPFDSDAVSQGGIEPTQTSRQGLGKRKVSTGGLEGAATQEVGDKTIEKAERSTAKKITRKVSKGFTGTVHSLQRLAPGVLRPGELSKKEIRELGAEAPSKTEKPNRKITKTSKTAIVNKTKDVIFRRTSLSEKHGPTLGEMDKPIDQSHRPRSQSLPSNHTQNTEEVSTQQQPVEQEAPVKRSFSWTKPQMPAARENRTQAAVDKAIHDELQEYFDVQETEKAKPIQRSDEQIRELKLRSIAGDLKDVLISKCKPNASIKWDEMAGHLRGDLEVLEFKAFGEHCDDGADDLHFVFSGEHSEAGKYQPRIAHELVKCLDEALTGNDKFKKASAVDVLKALSSPKQDFLQKLNDLPKKPSVTNSATEEPIQPQQLQKPAQIKEKETVKTQETQEQTQSPAQVTKIAEKVISYIKGDVNSDLSKLIDSDNDLEGLVNDVDFEGYTDQDLVGVHSLDIGKPNHDDFKKLELFLNHLSTILNYRNEDSVEHEAATQIINLIGGPKAYELLQEIKNLTR